MTTSSSCHVLGSWWAQAKADVAAVWICVVSEEDPVPSTVSSYGFSSPVILLVSFTSRFRGCP